MLTSWPSPLPAHVDSWLVVSRAHQVQKDSSISFLGPISQNSTYPPGAHLHLAVSSSITGIPPLNIIPLFRFVFFMVLGLLLYTLSKKLFKNQITAIVISLFSPLALSNITMLGPAYLVPLTWGMLLALAFFRTMLDEKWIIASILFLALAFTHRSSLLFALLTIGLYYLITNRRRLLYLLPFAIIATIIILISPGPEYLINVLAGLFTFSKQRPYLVVKWILPWYFLTFLAIGIFATILKERKAAKFLIPIFSFMAINAFLYWYWQGFLLVYRRLFTYLFLMSVPLIGYGVYALAERIESFWKPLKKYHIVLIIALLLLIPLAIQTNLEARERNLIHVTEAEHLLLTEFAQTYPGTSLIADHLESIALPYYNIPPVQLSPGHGLNTLDYGRIAPCYYVAEPDCFAQYMAQNNISFVYPHANWHVTYFQPIINESNLLIYQFDRNLYKESQENQTQ
jgi:hypothetical protein